VTQVTDYTCGATVGRDSIPVVLYEARVKMIDGVPTKQEKYAVMVPPKKDVGIVCAGCYTQQMMFFTNSRCVSCRTFVLTIWILRGVPQLSESWRTVLCKYCWFSKPTLI
jgi:hypothetical protein